jgi:hypothetical protein
MGAGARAGAWELLDLDLDLTLPPSPCSLQPAGFRCITNEGRMTSLSSVLHAADREKSEYQISKSEANPKFEGGNGNSELRVCFGFRASDLSWQAAQNSA